MMADSRENTAQQQQFNRQLCQFLNRSTTPFHAVAAMAQELRAAGYTPLAEDESWTLRAGGFRLMAVPEGCRERRR